MKKSSGKVENVILIIADISGYTKFMLKHKSEVEHSQIVISELINSIIEKVEIPLTISKLEGDAVFMYSLIDKHPEHDLSTVLGEKIIEFYDAFEKKLIELVEHNVCDCEACKHIRNLRLKIFVHKGEALLYRVANFDELSGVDVIIIHRLLKNEVDNDEYILFTEEAHDFIILPEDYNVNDHIENIKDVGEKKVFVHFPPGIEKLHERLHKEDPLKHKHAHIQDIAKVHAMTDISILSFLKDFYLKKIKPLFDKKSFNKNYRYLNSEDHSINENIKNK